MIFKDIKKITDKKEKSFFVEKINLYMSIVECLAQIKNLDISSYESTISDEVGEHLIEIGVISNISDISLLKKLIGNSFKRFVQSINFSILNEKIIGQHLDKLSNTKRAELQLSEMNIDKPTIVDFFCGAGGLSYGFIKEGYKILLANDFEDVCINTYTYNHPEVNSKNIIEADIKQLVDTIDNYITDEVDLIIGGPPCQGFSSANQQRIIDDPRNELYKYFLTAVEKLAPKFVVMENVRGMLPYANQIIDDYHSLKVVINENEYTYNVSCKILVSDDYGVSQKRQRLIFIAIRQDIAELNQISPELLFENIENSTIDVKKHILKDALEYIKELEANRIKNTNEIDSPLSGSKVSINNFKGNESTYLRLINTNREIPILYNHKARFVSDLNYDIYRLLDQGDDATNGKIEHLMPYSHRNNVFKDKYFKLVADRPSRTITAHMRMDCHSHIHPFQVRSLTPREAARIQSFPDDYVFLGAYLKTYMQIGNAVPPVMASFIAREIKKYL